MGQERRSRKKGYGKQCAVAALGLCAVVLPHPAGAHGVYMYAWTEGAQVCTESYFSRTDKVQGGRVRMSAADNSVEAAALTDENGRACFGLPEADGPLTFTVDAGQGHRASCTLSSAEIRAAHATAQRPDTEATTPDKPTYSDEQGREAIRAARFEGPGWREIGAGLGWIMGLASLTHLVLTRRKKPSSRH